MYIVTGKTRMRNGYVCMSIYDTENSQYLRPIPLGGRILENEVSDINVFSYVDIQEYNINININHPHTEDFPIISMRKIGELNRNEQINFLENISDGSLNEVFGYNNERQPLLRSNGRSFYVLPNTGFRSLGTIFVNDIEVYDDFYNNTKVNFTDMDNRTYEGVKLVCHDGLNTYNLDRFQNKFIRVSLSRAFQPNNWEHSACFLQVSGIHCY